MSNKKGPHGDEFVTQLRYYSGLAMQALISRTVLYKRRPTAEVVARQSVKYARAILRCLDKAESRVKKKASYNDELN